MSEVQRFWCHEASNIFCVRASDFDRVTAERDALQQRLNAADQRVDELERGQGQPVAWQYRVSAGPATGWSLWHDGKGDEFRNSYQVENRPLYTAPPAPVAVVLPDRLGSPESIKAVLDSVGRAGRVSYWDARDIWNACLDAVAAKLNISK